VGETGRTSTCRLEGCCIALLFWTGTVGAPAFCAEPVGGAPAAGDPAVVPPALGGEARSTPTRQYDFGVGYSLTYNTNITRSPTPTAGCAIPPCAETTEQIFAGITYEEHSAALNARLTAQAERRRFLTDVYQDDTGFFVDGAGIWTIVPRHFTWALEDTFREVPLDLAAPDTPANRAKANSFSTGPEFSFRLGPANVPVIGARYGRYDIEDVDSLEPGLVDSYRYTVYGRWLRLVSPLTTLSLNAEGSRIYFDYPVQPVAQPTSIRREDLFLRYELALPYNRQTLDLGATRVAQYGNEELNRPELNRPLLRYFGQLSVSAETALRLSLYDQVSDTYSDMIRNVTSLTIPTIPTTPADAAALSGTSAAAAADIYESRGGELVFVDLRGLLAYSLLGYVRRIDYLNLPQDQDYGEKGGRASVTLLFSPQAQAYAFSQYRRRNFSISNEQDTDRDTRVGAIYKMGPNFTITGEAGWMKRESTSPTDNYVDRQAMLILGYSTGPLYLARSRR
jgi:hypothetical protein